MMKPGTTPGDSPRWGFAPSPARSARSAVETACGQPITAERAEDAERAGSLNNTPRPHDEPSNDARWRKPQASSGPSSAPCPSPHNSARSAVETACGQPITAERAEDAEKAGSLNDTPGSHDETWNEARWRQNTGPGPSSAPCPSPRNSARSAVETACRSQRRTAETAERAGSLNNTPRPHVETQSDARWRQNTGPGPSSTPCPSPHNSARSAVSTARCSWLATAGTRCR